jgi:glyoxylase-like metal-dependent hydrolase (beta-lactamase superfamily II)
MQIHCLTTGRVRLKHAFLYPAGGLRRQAGLFLPGPYVPEAMPIHAWAVEHAGRTLLVDTGETAAVNDIPFARFEVGPDDELPGALKRAGLSIDQVDEVVLTHMHGDHMDGAVHRDGPVLVHETELAYSRARFSRMMARLLGQPIPAGVDFHPFVLDGGPFGAFAASRALSGDGRIVAVATPGHTPGHISVICVDDFGRHVLLAGDTTDSLEQLHALRPDAVAPKAKVHVETMRRILAHGHDHATVYLPSHDPGSEQRLLSRAPLAPV